MKLLPKPSLYANGKPRRRQFGPWSLDCRSRCVEFGLSFDASELQGHQHHAFRLETAKHCEYMAAWLLAAAKFLKSEARTEAAR